MLAEKYTESPLYQEKEMEYTGSNQHTSIKKNTITKHNKYVKRRLIVISIIAGAIFINSGAVIYSQTKILHKKQRENTVLHKEFKKLNKEEIELASQIKLLQNTEYIEQIARRDYFLTKKGEVVFHIGK